MQQFKYFTKFFTLVLTVMYTSLGTAATIRAFDQEVSLNYADTSNPIIRDQSQEFMVDTFDNSLGTLTRVIFTTTVSASNSARIQNNVTGPDTETDFQLHANTTTTTPFDQFITFEDQFDFHDPSTPGEIFTVENELNYTLTEYASSANPYTNAIQDSFSVVIDLLVRSSILGPLINTVLDHQVASNTRVTIDYEYDAVGSTIGTVPLPAATWLMISGLLGIFAFSRNKLKVSG